MLHSILSHLEQDSAKFVNKIMSEVKITKVVSDRNAKNFMQSEYESNGVSLTFEYDTSALPIENLPEFIMVSAFIEEHMLLLHHFSISAISTLEFTQRKNEINEKFQILTSTTYKPMDI